MRRHVALFAAATLCATGVLAATAAAGAAGSTTARIATTTHPAEHPTPAYRPVCPRSAPVQCRSFVRTDVRGLAPNGLPNGYGPADLISAYDLPNGGKGVTVAITGAGGYSKAESDLATYRSTYGLKPCTIASGCLTLVNEKGKTSPLPPDNSNWWGESALDMDMVSASCPACKILYVEANKSEGDTGLLTSINTAVKLGAPIVTNSWGEYGAGSWPDKDYKQYFDHPGHLILFASGDIGYGDAEPNSKYLVMVGSTSLERADSKRGWSESVWAGSTSWCTTGNKPAKWMPNVGCSGRLMVDVSTVGDPDTGVAVNVDGQWHVEGGTSASSPFVAGIYALGGHATSIKASRSLYDTPKGFHDVTQGSDGSCTPAIFCTAQKGYDAASGMGTPNGIAAFR
jgi:subtilase family serine protease